ncbi:G2/mitotic-specific cyclin-B2-like [Dreissena polymorpha]|nr:G2/mitotic-specific cyclin-B2-like [Dreissena polymorpha]
MAHIVASRNNILRQNASKKANDEKMVARKTSELTTTSMANFKYAKSEGLSDNTNLSSNHGGGYISKIRLNSVSGKPKEVKKVPLVRTHSKVFFKPGGRRTSTSERKPFSVAPPDQAVPTDHVLSPMDVDSPMVMIRNKQKKPSCIVDIDAMCDPLNCSEYAQDIIDYLQAVERRFSFPTNFLSDKKSEVSPQMRSVLMDWLIQVQVHQELSQYTLHLCANLIDKFLAHTKIQLNVLQLLGITCLLLAAKFHERFPPEITDLCRLTDDTYKPDQVLKMERYVLKKLEFNLNLPGPIVFLDRFLMVNACDKNDLIKSMAVYLLDLLLIEISYVHFFPSVLAASCLYVAREVLGVSGEEVWDRNFMHYTKYSVKDMEACISMVQRALNKQSRSRFQGAKNKYAHHVYHGISKHRSVLRCVDLWPEESDEVFGKTESPEPLETIV